jgi:hypothetical protein
MVCIQDQVSDQVAMVKAGSAQVKWWWCVRKQHCHTRARCRLGSPSSTRLTSAPPPPQH